MINKIWASLSKYIKKSRNPIKNSKVIKEIPFALMTNSCNAGFKFISVLTKEARNKCAEAGYEIDHVYIFTSYDAPLLFVQNTIKSGSDEYMAICQREDGNCFCAIFLGSWIEAE